MAWLFVHKVLWLDDGVVAGMRDEQYRVVPQAHDPSGNSPTAAEFTGHLSAKATGCEVLNGGRYSTQLPVYNRCIFTLSFRMSYMYSLSRASPSIYTFIATYTIPTRNQTNESYTSVDSASPMTVFFRFTVLS